MPREKQRWKLERGRGVKKHTTMSMSTSVSETGVCSHASWLKAFLVKLVKQVFGGRKGRSLCWKGGGE
jgi:hypothetical protein